MTRQKKENRHKYIKDLLILFIESQGYFDWWLDDYLFSNVARTVGCGRSLVKKIFFNDLLINNKDFIKEFEY